MGKLVKWYVGAMKRSQTHPGKGGKGSKTKKNQPELPPPGASEPEWKAFNDPELTGMATEIAFLYARYGRLFIADSDDALAFRYHVKPRYLDTSFEDGLLEIVLCPDALRIWRDDGEPDEAGHDRFREYVYGLLEREGEERYHHNPGKGLSLSRQARDLVRTAKAYERQAKKDPANADKWRARAEDCREASKLALEASRVSRDPLEDGSDLRHTISTADTIMLDLLNDVARWTGKPPFKVLAPLRKAAGLPYDTPNSLRAFVSNHKLPKPRT